MIKQRILNEKRRRFKNTLPGLNVEIVFYTYQGKKKRKKKNLCHMHFKGLRLQRSLLDKMVEANQL